MRQAEWLTNLAKVEMPEAAKEAAGKAFIEKDYSFVEMILLSCIEREYSIELDSLIAQLPQNEITKTTEL